MKSTIKTSIQINDSELTEMNRKKRTKKQKIKSEYKFQYNYYTIEEQDTKKIKNEINNNCYP